jgi:hypothetical protein
VPAGVVQWTAREIGVPAGTDLAAYARGEWRWAHQDEIRREYAKWILKAAMAAFQL